MPNSPMPILDFDQRLQQAAFYLRDHPSLQIPRRIPVYLDTLLTELGIGPVILEQDRRRHGGLRKLGDRWHPIVYTKDAWNSSLDPSQRFTVAHELGHALIDEQFELRP